MSQNKRRRATVTGAASGIGQAVVRRLVREGVAVTAVDMAADRLEAMKAPGIETLVANVADPADRARIVEASVGGDYLVNAAGIIRLKPLFDVTEQDWREIMAINAESVFFLTQKIGPTLNAGGSIVNLSSSSAKFTTTVEAAAYTASKTAILAITRTFAHALASRPVRVNAICPGFVDTPMQERLLDEVSKQRGTTANQLYDQRNKSVPLGRASTADECANAIWFLLSEESSYMTGQAINFTGGMITW